MRETWISLGNLLDPLEDTGWITLGNLFGPEAVISRGAVWRGRGRMRPGRNEMEKFWLDVWDLTVGE